MANLEFSGKESFHLPADTVFARLLDLDFIAEGIPDLVSSEKKSETAMACRIRPGFSFLRGTLDVQMEIVEAVPPERAKMAVAGKGIGASLEIETILAVTPLENGDACEVVWKSEVTKLGGLLRSVSKGLIQGAAAKVSGDIWADLHQRLEESDSNAG